MSPSPSPYRRARDPRALLDAGLAELGLPATLAEPLMAYLAELEKWNAAYNLTAIRDPAEMVTRHLLDSLALLPHVRGRLLDVGAGAGLPGIPLAIANPALDVTVLDSNGKKVRFMRHAVRTLGLPNVTVAEARAESFEAERPFERICSRAFASLADFFNGTGALLAPGGEWVAMKGKLDAKELAEVPARFVIRGTHRLQVPGLDEDRHAVIAGLK
ncbi:MAG TPA: 16S rRNA (guanine(527)-N(7))-methyltransferase RsmG [Solimonas sp.]|nr:16S rRNA (guanine(527)-N(7))-methyltransferase RsmG [Solimonas sp.]